MDLLLSRAVWEQRKCSSCLIREGDGRFDSGYNEYFIWDYWFFRLLHVDGCLTKEVQINLILQLITVWSNCLMCIRFHTTSSHSLFSQTNNNSPVQQNQTHAQWSCSSYVRDGDEQHVGVIFRSAVFRNCVKCNRIDLSRERQNAHTTHMSWWQTTRLIFCCVVFN